MCITVKSVKEYGWTRRFQHGRSSNGTLCTGGWQNSGDEAVCDKTNFNLCSPCGERRQRGRGHLQGNISTHAPARGATYDADGVITLDGFQSTLPHGERRRHRGHAGDVGDFNPRSPCGERLIALRILLQVSSFQSRSPYGERRRELCADQQPVRISTHAPRVGSDHGGIHFVVTLGISIHAPRVGSDLALVTHAALRGISIHAPARGATGVTTTTASRMT